MKAFRLIMYALLIMFAACSDGGSDEPIVTPPNKPDTSKPTITFDSGTNTKPVVATEGGTSTIIFTATQAWTASISESRAIDWISVSPTNGGAGKVTLIITTKANDTYDERNASITLSSGGQKQTITVSQKQKDALTVTSNKVEMTAEGGDFTIEAKANVSISYEIGADAKEWIKSSSSRGLTTTKLSFTADANGSTEKRQGTILIKGDGGLNETVTVYQTGEEPTLILSQNTFTAPAEGDTIKIELQSNTEYKLELPKVSWINETSSRTTSTYTHYIMVAPNETYDERNASIFVVWGDNKREAVTITQKQLDALLVTSDKVEMTAEGGTASIEVKANVNYTYEIEESAKSWITKAESRGLETTTIALQITENESTEKREGKVTVKSGAFSETVTIYQAGTTPILVLTQNEYIVNDNGETIKIELQSNAEYKIKIPNVDWIRESIGTRTLSTYTHYFDILPNEENVDRIADIIFMDESASICDTVYITQLRKGALILSKRKYEMPQEGGEFDLRCNSEVESSIEIPATNGWISVEEEGTNGTHEKKLHVKVEANQFMSDRTGIIVVRETGTQLADTVHIIQLGAPNVVLNQKEFSLSYEETEISIKADGNCKIDIIDPQTDWLSPYSGSSSVDGKRQTRNYKVKTNTTSEERIANIIIAQEGGNAIDTVRVRQSCQGIIIIAKKEFTISEKEGEFDLEYRTEFDCDIAVSDNWISINDNNSRSFTDQKLQIKVSSNTTSEDRVGNIIFTQKNGNLKDTIKIIQVINTTFIVPKNLYEVSEITCEFDLEYTSNLNLQVDIPDEYNWISLAEDINGNLKLKVEDYFENKDREGTITLRDYTGTNSEKIQIKQAGSNYYLRCPNNVNGTGYICTDRGGILSHYIESNGDYKFEIIAEDASWIRHLRTEKIGENKFHEVYEVDENSTGKERQCNIRVSLGNIVLQFTLAQIEYREFSFSQTEFNVSSEGGSFPLEIKANGDWAKTVSPYYHFQISNDAASWISLENNAQYGFGYDEAKLIIKPNLTNKNRSAEIIFSPTYSETIQYVNIYQSSQGAIVLSPQNSYILSSSTHSITLDMATSDYTVEIDNVASSWISLGNKNGKGENTKQELLIAENTSRNERKGKILFVSSSSKNQIEITQLMPPPTLVDDTPAKWHQFPLSKVELILNNPASEGSQIYSAIVPDCEALIAIASHKVLDCLYNDPNNPLIRKREKLEYVLEDYDGVSYNAGGGMRIGLSNQYLANYYHTYGAEAMIKENIGILTHELTHSYQAEPKNCGGYQPGTHYFAFIEGVADAVRVLCGGFPNDSDRPRGGHYMDAYRHGGFFIAWLVKNKDENFLRKFNESAHKLETWTFDAGVKYALGESYSADALWNEYQKAMGDI